MLFSIFAHVGLRWAEWTGWIEVDKIAKDARHGRAFFIEGGEVGGDAVDVDANEGLLAIWLWRNSKSS